MSHFSEQNIKFPTCTALMFHTTCFTWIIYVAPCNMFPLTPIFYALFSFLKDDVNDPERSKLYETVKTVNVLDLLRSGN